jgi:hypothetical protein
LKFEFLSDEALLRYRLLFPWYVNCLLPGESSDLYSEKIRKYESMNFEQLRTQNAYVDVIKEDTELSTILTAKKVPHYKYFGDNLYYFQFKGKYGFDQ